MGRAPKGLTLKLRSLKVGESVIEMPAPGEGLPEAVKRLRSGLPRSKVQHLSFRCRIDGEAVRIEAVSKGTAREASLKSMKAGQYLLITTAPSAADIKKARDRASYASLSEGTGVWEVVVDRKKGLMIVCLRDAAGSFADVKSDTHVPDDAEVLTRI